MTDKGYIKLYRKSINNDWLKNHKLWAFWSYCLLKSSHKKHTIKIGFQNVELNPGQFAFGLNVASEETNLSIQSIRTCLAYLKKSQNLTIKTTNKFSIITICKWETYQNDKIDDQQANQQTTNKPLTTYNNVKNVKNKDKRYMSENFPKPVHDLYNFFLSTLSEDELKIYEPKTDKVKYNWLDTLDKCHRIDKFEYWMIKDVIEHYREDEFWKTNFYSPVKLRTKTKNDTTRIKEWYFNIKHLLREPTNA